MIATKEFVSRESLYRSRYLLNADGYDSGRAVHEPFVTEEFPTGARTKDGRLFFGNIKDREEFLLPAKAVIRWAQPRGAEKVLDIMFRWHKPQSGLVLRPVEHELLLPVNAEFDKPINSLRVESFHNRTRVTFGCLALDGCQVYVEPVETQWDASEPVLQLAQDLLVTEHIDKIVCGKVRRAVEGEIPLDHQFSATL